MEAQGACEGTEGWSPWERPGLRPLGGVPHGGAAVLSRLSRSDSLMLFFLSYFFRFLVIFIFHLSCLFLLCALCSVETLVLSLAGQNRWELAQGAAVTGP